jgi:hypothetical protein
VFKIQLKETVLILKFFTPAVASGVDLFSDFLRKYGFRSCHKRSGYPRYLPGRHRLAAV